MQLVLPWWRPVGRLRKARPADPTHIEVNARAYPVKFARHRRARRYVLRMTGDGALRITVPRGASIDGAVAFAQRQNAWIEREQARRDVRLRAWSEGGLVWFRGEQVPFGPGFEQRLRSLAGVELPERCSALAKQHGVTIGRVSIRNQRSRWGSCSPRGTIALNWRLIQMPPFVSDYVILHELMHTRQANHSRRFWREVERVCTDWRAAEKWLRTHGRELL
jgi:predicted metal-dependent hydrolase